MKWPKKQVKIEMKEPDVPFWLEPRVPQITGLTDTDKPEFFTEKQWEGLADAYQVYYFGLSNADRKKHPLFAFAAGLKYGYLIGTDPEVAEAAKAWEPVYQQPNTEL